MYINHTLGVFGENLACNYLEQNNYSIIERNFRCWQGEIDIIAKDKEKNELVFIEVKTRSSFVYGVPSAAVNNKKKQHIFNVALFYLYKNKIKNVFMRFDVIEIFVKNYNFKINHIKQII